MRIFGIFSLAQVLLVSYHPALAQDDNPSCAACITVSSTLAECTLPPLSTDYKTVVSDKTLRNISQVPGYIDGVYPQPSTRILSSLEDASCLCAPSIKIINPCGLCTYYDHEVDDNTTEYNQWQMTDIYFADCRAFGYNVNDTQGSPSTTHTSSPTVTAPISQKPTDCPACDPLVNQLTQCNETSNSATYPALSDTWPFSPSVWDTTDDGSFVRHILMNRTMGECVCTLPVLRRFLACESCAGGNMLMTVIDYTDDCADLGYYTDRNIVLPGSSSSRTTEIPTATSAPKASPNSNGGPIGRASAITGIMWTSLGYWFSVLLL